MAEQSGLLGVSEELEVEVPMRDGVILRGNLYRPVGKAQGLPEDAAHNHDHYLYGLPKK